jgi:hypothetical protein
MPKPSVKSVWLELQIDPNDPELLVILDRLVRSNILTHAQIRKIARECLSEDLPWKSARVAAPVIDLETSEAEIAAAPVAKISAAPVPKIPSPIQTIWQTLKDELSVRWLLFLGVFLVVLSSGVLAATQWSRFPAWGQYGLLWLYTIGFWVVGGWARRQEGLSLTASTLQLVTILLIPVNFWAIDSFGLWHQPLELVTAIVAGVSLVGIAYIYWRGSVGNQRLKPPLVMQSPPFGSAQGTPTRTNRSNYSGLLLGTYVVLSFLHLGWQIPYWSAIAIYIGAIGSAIVLQKTRRIEGGALAIYGLGILLLRGRFVAHLPIYTFGLAIGTVGWLFAQWSIQKDRQLARLNRHDRQLPLRVSRYQGTLTEVVRLYRGVGVSLLILGWLLGIGDLASAPKASSWQAFGVSCLGLVWIWQRLRKDWQNRDVVVLFLVGLQTYIVSSFLWAPLSTGAILARLLPTIILLFGQNYLVAGSLLIFPYLLIWVWLTGWFHRQGKTSASGMGESLVLGTGALLPIVNFSNPLSLLVDLLGSTAILAYLTLRYLPIRSSYIYLTHLCGLATIFAAISYRADWCRSIASNFVSGASNTNSSVLDFTVLAIVLSTLSIGELWFSAQPVGRKSDGWRRSSWYIGLVLATLTYACFATLATFPTARIISSLWWLLIPISFTYIATCKPPLQPWQLQNQIPAAWCGIAGLGAGVLLTTIDRVGYRSIFLIAAVGIMFPLVKRLQGLSPALIQIGLGLGLGVNLLIGQIFPTYWLIIGAITCACLWFASPKLSPIYAEASDIWANGIAGLGIAIGTINYAQTDLNWFANGIGVWLKLDGLNTLQTALEGGSTEWFHSIQLTILLSTVILVGSIALRERWRNSSIFEWNWFFGWSWAMQIALAALIHLLGGDTLTLATANIILAFPLWIWLRPQATTDSKILICLLAGWGLILRLPFFTAYTGLLTVAVGILAVSVSQKSSYKSLGYGGILFGTLGCYELVAYPLLQSPPGGNIADALTIYGLVTAVLALGYRMGVWWKSRQGADNWLGLPLVGAKNVAHIHWAVASTWKVAAATMPAVPMPKLTLLHLFISVLLGGYALIQARDRDNNGDWWIYLGLAELLGVGVYARSIFQNLGVVDEGIILIACTIGLLLLLAPWRQWGWHDRPWRLVAFVLPLSRVVFEYAEISLLNLAVLAVFYAGVARRQRQFIWNYLSLIFIDWAVIRLLFQYHLTSPLWYAALIGLSILAVVQWDPYWQTSRQNRHYGRLLGSGTIAVTALVWHQPWLPIGIGLAIAIIGLLLKVRAWFYIGTITFLLTNLYQLLILITEYPITKWAIGLFAGILIITLAANFERRKEQIERAIKHWIDRLQEWQ